MQEHPHHRTRRAVDAFHGLIEKDLKRADRELEALLKGQRENNVLFGDRPMSKSLRPTFVTERLYTKLQDSVYLLRQAILRIAAAHFNNREVLFDDLGMEEWEVELAAIPTNVIRLSATARMDSFLTKRSFRFVEVNGEVPAGPAYVHQLGKIYRGLEIFQEFEKNFPVRFISPVEHLLANLVRVYHEEFGGREEKPRFAIVDFLNIPTYPEFLLMKEYFERHGFPCEISDPRQIECRDGWVYANGRKIDILYRRLLMNEYYEIRDDCKPYLEAYKAQKTCYLNSFRSKMVHKKAILALLTDDRFQEVLNFQQKKAIEDHIPWTRRLRERQSQFRGLEIDLVEFVRANRRYFVLKPNDAYGGEGVLLGFDCTQAEWDARVDLGLKEGFVVQEAVNIHREPFLMKGDQGWEYSQAVIDLDPYINGALMGGCLTRISASNLANVTAGGGTLPCFILRYE